MDEPPPAYSAVGNGESINAPPAYQPDASAPPQYNPSAPVSNPSAPAAVPVQQPNIKYVDQNGNPVAPPVQSNIKYVDQNGNPVNPPMQAQGQPAIKYVDQYGNPVAAPTTVQSQPTIKYVDQNGNPVNPPQQAQPAIKYVDQNGNPVAAPVQQGQPTIKYVDQYGNPVNPPANAQQPAVKYVDQYGNPVAAPTNRPAVKYVDQYGNPVNSPTNTAGRSGPGNAVPHGVKQQRIAATVLGSIGLFVLFIGLCVDNLANGYHWLDYDTTYICGWSNFRVKCDYDWSSSCTESETSYSDLCELGYESWCGTQASAALSVVTMLAATIFCAIAVILVQPWCKVTACCCKTTPNCGCGRACFGTTIAFSVLTLIIWYAGDDICTSSDDPLGVSMGMGGSMICNIIGLVFVVISTALVK